MPLCTYALGPFTAYLAVEVAFAAGEVTGCTPSDLGCTFAAFPVRFQAVLCHSYPEIVEDRSYYLRLLFLPGFGPGFLCPGLPALRRSAGVPLLGLFRLGCLPLRSAVMAQLLLIGVAFWLVAVEDDDQGAGQVAEVLDLPRPSVSADPHLDVTAWFQGHRGHPDRGPSRGYRSPTGAWYNADHGRQAGVWWRVIRWWSGETAPTTDPRPWCLTLPPSLEEPDCDPR